MKNDGGYHHATFEISHLIPAESEKNPMLKISLMQQTYMLSPLNEQVSKHRQWSTPQVALYV